MRTEFPTIPAGRLSLGEGKELAVSHCSEFSGKISVDERKLSSPPFPPVTSNV